MYKYFLFLFITCLLSTKTSAQTIYGNADNNDLIRLDLSNCSYEVVVNFAGTYTTDIAFHPNGKLYGISDAGQMFEIDTLSGGVLLINNFPFDYITFTDPIYNSLTIAADGLLYTARDNGELWTYNFMTSTETLLGNIGASPAGDLTFYEGNLYMTTLGDDIVQIDINDPSNSTIAINSNINGALFGIVSFAEDCNDVSTYAFAATGGTFPDETDLYSVNFNNNTITFLCNLDIVLLGGASIFESVASTNIEINDLTIQDVTCGNDNGSISVTASGGIGELEYSLDATNFQFSNTFENLLAGEYTLYVQDENGCTSMSDVTIINTEEISILAIETSPSTCDGSNGFIELILENDSVLLSFDEGEFMEGNIFENLNAGTYEIVIQDEYGCEIDTLIQISNQISDCSIVIPNAFTPDGDNLNDLFNVVPASASQVLVNSLKIFNRWGEIVFDKKNVAVNAEGWDGTKDGTPLPSDVYVYIFEIEYASNNVEIISGDITLIR